MVTHSKVKNQYTELAEAMFIFNKYVKYEVNSTPMVISNDDLHAGGDIELYTEADKNRLGELKWVYSEDYLCWTYSEGNP